MTIDELITWCQRLAADAERFNEELKTWQSPNQIELLNAWNLSGGTATGLRRILTYLHQARKEAGG